MDALKMAHGPWTVIFQGTWSGHEVHFYENPDRHTLTVIFEKKGKKVGGVVVILNKYFVVSGVIAGIDKLIERVEQQTQIIEKHYPAFKAKYLVLSSGPAYMSFEEIEEGLENAFDIIEAGSEKINSISKEHGIDLTELKFAKPEFADRFFSEPLSLPTVITRQGAGTPAVGVTKARPTKFSLGELSSGKVVEEQVEDFFSTLIIGNDAQRKNGMQLLIENCALNRVSSIIFDDTNAYKDIGMPNKEFDFKKYPDLQPVGMPLKNPDIALIGVNLNLLDSSIMKEVIGIRGEEGSMAFSLISKVIDESKGNLKSLEDMMERLGKVKDSGKKFQIRRGVRMLKILDMTYPELFKEKTNTRMLVSPMLGGMGAVTRIDVTALSKPVRDAFIYSALQSVYNESENSVDVKVMAFVLSGKTIAPRKINTELQDKVIDVLGKCNSKGIGFCLTAEHEIDIIKEIEERITAKIDFVSDKEVAVRHEGKKPYRIKLRPMLSG